MATKYGPVAHLGERFNGIEEVAGSIPVRSKINNLGDLGLGCHASARTY